MSSWGSRKRAKARKEKQADSDRRIAAAVADWDVRRKKIYGTAPYDQLADPEYNRHVVFWEMGELRANFEVTREEDGWLSLHRGDNRCMWYHPVSRKAFWTGFSEVVEFFIKDIEAYIKLKFYHNDQSTGLPAQPAGKRSQ